MRLKILIILNIFILSCNSDLGSSFKIMNDLQNNFDFNSVEMSWNDETTTFILQDIDHSDLTIDSLKSYSIKVDKYLSNKYPKIDSLNTRNYLFSGGGGFEIIKFTLDNNNKIINTEEY